MYIRVLLKNSREFVFKCEEFEIRRDAFNVAIGYSYKNATENQPLYIDFDEVVAMLRVDSAAE